MATIRCPRCGHTEPDGRPHDREQYEETCARCASKPCCETVQDRPTAGEIAGCSEIVVRGCSGCGAELYWRTPVWRKI